MKMLFEVGPENSNEKRMMALLHCHLEKFPDVWKILRVGVFSFRYFALDKIPWNSCWVRISKKNRPSQCPKRKADRRFRIPTPWNPPPSRRWKSSHGQGWFWGDIQVAVFSGLGAQIRCKKRRGPLTMYIHRKLTGWKIQHEWSLYVLLEDGGFSNVMLVFRGVWSI